MISQSNVPAPVSGRATLAEIKREWNRDIICVNKEDPSPRPLWQRAEQVVMLTMLLLFFLRSGHIKIPPHSSSPFSLSIFVLRLFPSPYPPQPSPLPRLLFLVLFCFVFCLWGLCRQNFYSTKPPVRQLGGETAGPQETCAGSDRGRQAVGLLGSGTREDVSSCFQDPPQRLLWAC